MSGKHAGMDAPSLDSPILLIAGDSWQYTRSLTGYSAADWALSVRVVSATTRLDAAVSAVGSDWLVTFSPAQTSGLAPGAYTLVEVLSRTGERVTVGRYPATVQPDPMGAEADLRGPFRKALDEARAHLATFASSGMWRAVEIQTADRTTKCNTIGELRNLIRLLETEAERESRERSGLPAPRAGTLYGVFGSSV